MLFIAGFERPMTAQLINPLECCRKIVFSKLVSAVVKINCVQMCSLFINMSTNTIANYILFHVCFILC